MEECSRPPEEYYRIVIACYSRDQPFIYNYKPFMDGGRSHLERERERERDANDVAMSPKTDMHTGSQISQVTHVK